jgi:hypothetical protein
MIKTIIRWFFVVGLVVLAIGVSFWFLFYSPFIANDSIIISLRNWYQDTYWKVGGVGPVYTIQPQKPLEQGKNTYTLIGTFSKLDLTKDYAIVLKDKDGNSYTFLANYFFFKDTDLWLRILQTPNIHTLAIGILPGSGTKPPVNAILLSKYSQTRVKDGQLAVSPATIAVRWNDKRTLSQILSDYQKGKDVPLNSDSTDSTVLAEFK